MNGMEHDYNNSESITLKDRRRSNSCTPILLFLMTIVTIVMAGMVWEGLNPIENIKQFYHGLQYAGILLAILASHALGQYLMARYYGMDVTLPYFIPSPPPFLFGTFGTFVRLHSPAPHRKALLIIAAVGPIAGFCVALPVVIYAYATSAVVPLSTLEGGIVFNEPLLLQLIGHLIFGPIPHDFALQINSVGIAAWLEFQILSLRLLPIGQFEGGHIAYAVLGHYARYVSRATIGAMLIMGFFYIHWFGLAFVGWLVSLRQPIILDQKTPLEWRCRIMVCVNLVIFVLSFMPIPIELKSIS